MNERTEKAETNEWANDQTNEQKKERKEKEREQNIGNVNEKKKWRKLKRVWFKN